MHRQGVSKLVVSNNREMFRFLHGLQAFRVFSNIPSSFKEMQHFLVVQKIDNTHCQSRINVTVSTLIKNVV